MTLLDNYGKRLSYDYIERLAQRYDNYDISVAPSDKTRAEIYDYKNNANAKEDVNSVWVNQFGTIANLNNLLFTAWSTKEKMLCLRTAIGESDER